MRPKTVKNALKKLSMAFAIAALPFLVVPSSADAFPSIKKDYSPEGVWQTMDGSQMIVDVSRCTDNSSSYCATIYRTSKTPIEDIVNGAKDPSKITPAASTPGYCSLYNKMRISKLDVGQWESDDISLYGIFSARAKIDMVLSVAVRVRAEVKAGPIPMATFYSNAQKIPPASKEFKPCLALKP